MKPFHATYQINYQGQPVLFTQQGKRITGTISSHPHALPGNEFLVTPHTNGEFTLSKLTKINVPSLVGRIQNGLFIADNAKLQPFTIQSELLKKPFQTSHRFFATLDYTNAKEIIVVDLRELGPDFSLETNIALIEAQFKLSEISSPTKPIEQAKQAVAKALSDPKRTNFNDWLTFTIDPAGSKDFDDAISFRLSRKYHINKQYEIAVHIADVATAIAPKSELDQLAQERGNTTYLVGKNYPMLPRALSEDALSLTEGEHRVVKSVIFRFDKEHRVINTRFVNGTIRSHKRLTYAQATQIIKSETNNPKINSNEHITYPGQALDSFSRLAELTSALKQCFLCAQYLKSQRKTDLDFTFPKLTMFRDPTTNQLRPLMEEAADESHMLIQEFMLLANQSIAKFLEQHKRALLHRIHLGPDQQDYQTLIPTLRLHGIYTPKVLTYENYVKVLLAIHKHPASYKLLPLIHRCMQSAEYSTKNLGHFGLQFKHYAHFTSPIRRYADLIVQRQLDSILLKKKAYSVKELNSISQQINQAEYQSSCAEKLHLKLSVLTYLNQNPNQTHSVQITQIFPKEILGFIPSLKLPVTVKNPANKTLSEGNFYTGQVANIDLNRNVVTINIL